MLNIPVYNQSIEINENKISAFEKVEFEQRLNWDLWFQKYTIRIDIIKHFETGTFEILIHNIEFSKKKIIVSINNKFEYISPEINTGAGSSVLVLSESLGYCLFNDVKTLAIAINVEAPPHKNYKGPIRRWARLSELSVKISREQLSNKILSIDQNGLIIETISKLIFYHHQRQDEKYDEKIKSKIKITPEKLNIGQHNINLFKIENLTPTIPPLIVPKSIEGLEIVGNNKPNAKFQISEIDLTLKNNLIGYLIFDQTSYYNFRDEKTHMGIGVNSQNGYLIPYKFKGVILPSINLDLGFLKDLTIYYSNPINQSYLDKYSGLIKLKIFESNQEYDNNYQNTNIILRQDFDKIVSGNLSLIDILNLGKKNEK